MRVHHRVVLAALWAAPLLISGGGDDPAPGAPPVTNDEHLVPDFTLKDVNTTSPTFDHDVSPRQYLGTISAWYFGHAT